MKKIILTSILFMLFMGVVSASSINGDYKGNPVVKVLHNGVEIAADDAPGLIYDNRAMVPIYLLKKLGAVVTWNQDNYSVDIKLPETAPKNTTPDVDGLIDKFGVSGSNSVSEIRYFTIGKGQGVLEFDLTFGTGDTTKNKEYNDLINAAVDANVYQVMFKYIDKFDSIITIEDTKNYWSKKITLDEYLSKIHIVNENTAQNPSTNAIYTLNDAVKELGFSSLSNMTLDAKTLAVSLVEIRKTKSESTYSVSDALRDLGIPAGGTPTLAALKLAVQMIANK